MKLKPFFKFEVKVIEQFARNDADTVVNLILTADNNQKYFLKELQEHSKREGLDELYQQLHSVNAKLSKWILPLARHDGPDKYLFEIEGKNFLLFPFVQLHPFAKEKITLLRLWESLEEFHQLIKNKKFFKQNFRNYQSWMEMGSDRLKKKFGADLPFLNSFDEFMLKRFPLIQFQTWSIHWDIHEDNLAFDSFGNLILLDFDLVQEGTYAQEFVAAASMYVDWKKPFEETILQGIYKKIIPLSTGLKKEDVRYLLARNILGNLALVESKDKIIDQLKILDSISD